MKANNKIKKKSNASVVDTLYKVEYIFCGENVMCPVYWKKVDL